MSHFIPFWQDGSPGLLPGSTGPGFIPSGSSSLSGSVATALPVHIGGVHKRERQGERDLEEEQVECLCVVGRPSLAFLRQLHSWVAPAVENVSTMDPLQLAALGGLLPQLGAPFLLSLPSQLLLELLSQPGITRYSPAQVSWCLGWFEGDSSKITRKMCEKSDFCFFLSAGFSDFIQAIEGNQRMQTFFKIFLSAFQQTVC